MSVTAGSLQADVTNTATSTQDGDLILIERSGVVYKITAVNLRADVLTNNAGITAAGQALLDDADAAAQLVTLGIGNIDNTSDADKPVSTAQQAAIDALETQVAADLEARLVGATRDVPATSFGTSYQNTTGRDIKFAATISATATAALLLEFSTDNATWDPIQSATVTTPNQVTFGTTIPKDFYYRLRTTAGTGVVNSVRRYI